MKKILCVLGILLCVLTLSSCARNVSPNTYEAADVGVASKVIPGVIIAQRPVVIDANSGAGGLAGVAAGAAAGSAVGGSPQANIVGAVGGAVIGGVLGNMADKGINSNQGVEYIIKLKNGSTVSVVQTQDLRLANQQRVLVIYGAMTRIIPDTTPK